VDLTTTFSTVAAGSSLLFGVDVSLKLFQNCYFYVDVYIPPLINFKSVDCCEISLRVYAIDSHLSMFLIRLLLVDINMPSV
jgi:hypothetical protein